MSGFQVKGLLDRPSKESLGMLGLIVERDRKGLYTEGIVGAHVRPIEEGEFSELLSAGDAQKTDGPRIDDDSRAYASLWVGSAFAENAIRLKAPLPPLPKTSVTLGDNGTYWIAPIQHVWRVIDSWLILAFRRSVVENNAELATLMAWALPEREQTRAVLWYTMKDKRRSNLDWWTRLDQDHGNSRVSARKLNDRYNALSSTIRSPNRHRVIGFCAMARGGDKEVAETLFAERLSQDSDAKLLSFGKWLQAEAEKEGRKPTRRLLQQKGQQMIEKHGALAFCLELLSTLPPDVSIPNARFVIEGIRHDAVWKSLSSLIGEDQLYLVEIKRPDDERRQLLITKDHVSADEVKEVMNDATEKEISIVASHAARTFDMQQGLPSITKELGKLLVS